MQFTAEVTVVYIGGRNPDYLFNETQFLERTCGFKYEIGFAGEDGVTLVYCSSLVAATLLRLRV